MKLVASCITLLGLLHSFTEAFPNGAGRCIVDVAAAAPHGGPETDLAAGGYTLTVDGIQVLPGLGSTTVIAGQEFDITLSGPDFRGFLIMLAEEPEGDLVGSDGISKQADGSDCGGTASITHTSNDLKQEVTVTGVVMDPKTTQIEVNVVVQNSGGVSVYHYDKIDLEVAVADVVDGPESPPDDVEPVNPIETVEPTTTATVSPTETTVDVPSISELASDAPELSTLVSLLPGDLIDTLSEDGTFTVFAPLNSAFDALPDDLVESLEDDADLLRDVLLYHVLGTVVLSSDLEEGAVFTALNGGNLTVTSLDPVTINNAEVVAADILASNGVVHLIDTVLLPVTAEPPVETPAPTVGDPVTLPVEETEAPTGTETPTGDTSIFLSNVIVAEHDLSTLVDAAIATDAVEALGSPGSFTVFAPTNDAFANFPDQELLAKLLTEDWKVHLQALLFFHVSNEQYAAEDLFDGRTIPTLLIPPEELTVGVTPNGVTISGAHFSDANVVEADLFADNGVLHKVDQVFVPTALTLNLLEAASLLEGFDQVASFIVTAGLEETLTTGVVTVFGPNNDAFAKIPHETLQLVSDADALSTALQNHIVEGLWYRERLTAGTELTSLAGNTLTITEELVGDLFPQTKVNEATILLFDAVASNGLAHVISDVLLPPAPGNETETMPPIDTTEPPEPEVSTPAPTPVPTPMDDPSIAELVVDTPDLLTFVSLLSNDLVETLVEDGTLTVFAPLNSAFDALPDELAQTLQDDEVLLQNVLLNHVLGTVVLSSDLDEGAVLTTLNGAELTVTSPNPVTINGNAVVVTADIRASNGILHLIDKVLLPDDEGGEYGPCASFCGENTRCVEGRCQCVEGYVGDPYEKCTELTSFSLPCKDGCGNSTGGSAIVLEDVHKALPKMDAFFRQLFPDSDCFFSLIPARGNVSYNFRLDSELLGDMPSSVVDDEEKYMLSYGTCNSRNSSNIAAVVGIDLSAAISQSGQRCSSQCKATSESYPFFQQTCESDSSCLNQNTFSSCTRNNGQKGSCVAAKACTNYDMGSCCECGEIDGMCPTVATATLLVKSGTVDLDWPCVRQNNVSFSPLFLKAIRDATGDVDGDRGKTTKEVKKGIVASWNDKWQLQLTEESAVQPDDEAGIKDWCESLAERLADGDACMLLLFGGGAHAMSIIVAGWDDARKHCTVRTNDSGYQDNPIGSYSNVKIVRLYQTWIIGPNKKISHINTQGDADALKIWSQETIEYANERWPELSYTEANYLCYQKPRDAATTVGPGPAMPQHQDCISDTTPAPPTPDVPIPLPKPQQSCSDGLNSGTCELVDTWAGICPGRTQLRNQDLLEGASCDDGVCCADGTLTCVATGGWSGTCLGTGENCQQVSGYSSLVIPTAVGPCEDCCLSESVICTPTDESTLLGTCIQKTETHCPLPLPSEDCTSLDTASELVCCVLEMQECSYGTYTGECNNKNYCMDQDGVSIAGQCLGDTGSAIQCCLREPLPECISYGRFPGDCRSASECNALGKTPLLGFMTTDFSCSSGLFCCVEPPSCTSTDTEGNGGGSVSGTCLDESVCLNSGQEPVSGECYGEDTNIYCCIDLDDFPCSKDGTAGNCTDKDRCTGNQQVPFPLVGCPGSSEIQCCVDLPTCVVAGSDGECLPAAKCTGLPALSWHNCPGRVSHGVACCIPPGLVCLYDSVGGTGECKTSCDGLSEASVEGSQLCPDGLVCCTQQGALSCSEEGLTGSCSLQSECSPEKSWVPSDDCSSKGLEFGCCYDAPSINLRPMYNAVQITDIQVIGPTAPGGFLVFNNQLFLELFLSTSQGEGLELWKTDGSAAGTVQVKAVQPSGFFIVFNDEIFFSGNSELWKTDGTEAGTVLVKVINPDHGSSPREFFVFSNELFFIADDGTNGFLNGNELWKTDGTEAGTVRVKKINPNGFAFGIGFGSIEFTVFKNELFFEARGTGGYELWKTDGTEAGTVLVKDINPMIGGSSGPDHLTVLNNELFFAANDGTNGGELWKTDGTEEGTVLVKDINPNGGSDPTGFTVFNNELFFQADDGTNGKELWKTDGTEAGTVLVADVNPAGDSDPYGWQAYRLTLFHNKLFFAAEDGTNGVELWKTDGTEEGTVLVKDINPNGGSNPIHFTVFNNELFFQADDGTNGRVMWKTDGTEAGTVLVVDIYDPDLFTVFNNELFFRASSYNGEISSLWKLVAA